MNRVPTKSNSEITRGYHNLDDDVGFDFFLPGLTPMSPFSFCHVGWYGSRVWKKTNSIEAKKAARKAYRKT